MKTYYRFSFNLMPDSSGKRRNPPIRPEWFDKWKCLENFIHVFKETDITIIADGVDQATWEKLEKLYSFLNLKRTDFGHNAGSFLYCLDDACNLDPETAVYFSEDDYIHHEGSDLIIQQGLSISPYVSLYDHPDKYWGENSNKPCHLLMTEDCHWRTTGSTTMTFASKVKWLVEDKNIFKKWCGGADHWTHDFQLFSELSNKRNLITPVPGYATHMDSWVIAKMVNWKEVLDRTSGNI